MNDGRKRIKIGRLTVEYQNWERRAPGYKEGIWKVRPYIKQKQILVDLGTRSLDFWWSRG